MSTFIIRLCFRFNLAITLIVRTSLEKNTYFFMPLHIYLLFIIVFMESLLGRSFLESDVFLDCDEHQVFGCCDKEKG